MTRMNAAGKAKATDTIKPITTGGSTNLSGGLLEGLNILRLHK
jgi:hypothetical protein